MTPADNIFGEAIFSQPFTPQAGPGAIDQLLIEDGFKLLQEDGSTILLD